MYIILLNFFGKPVIQEQHTVVPVALVDWSKKNAEMQVTSEGKISEIAARYMPTRLISNGILTRIARNLKYSFKRNRSYHQTVQSNTGY